MGTNSHIEWTEHTFNPWWGCTKVSEGCTHCYAETWAKRTGFKIWGEDAERRFFGTKHWAEPIKWDEQARKLGVMHRVFCGSMCDIFEDRPGIEDPRSTVFDIAEATPNLLWLFLSKRPENARTFLPARWAANGKWPRNAMLGFTIENQKRLEQRVPIIRSILKEFPGASFFASCEPLLSELEFEGVEHGYRDSLDLFDWVIGGGESGPGARPMHPEWIRKLRYDCENRTDMCRPWAVPFLFKQWGEFQNGSTLGHSPRIEFTVLNDGRFQPLSNPEQHWDRETLNRWSYLRPTVMSRVGKKDAGRLLDGRTWDGVPMLAFGPQLPGVENYGAYEVKR